MREEKKEKRREDKRLIEQVAIVAGSRIFEKQTVNDIPSPPASLHSYPFSFFMYSIY